MKINRALGFVESLILSLVIISPFIGMLADRLQGAFGGAVSAYKEIVQLLAISILTIIAILNKDRVKLSLFSLVLLFYSFYLLFHIYGYFFGTLSINSFRYQFGYAYLFTLFLILSKSFSFESNINKFVNIIFYQSLVVLTVACIEILDDSIIGVLYGTDKSMMNNVSLAVGSRLISTLGNPINLGIYFSFAICAAYFIRSNKSSLYSSIFYYLLWIVTLVATTLTLSRMSLVTYVLVSFLFFIRDLMNKERVTIFLSLLVIPFFIIYVPILVDQSTGLFRRLDTIFSFDTYLNNPRFISWINVFSESDDWIKVLWGFGLGASNPTAGTGAFNIENSFVSVFAETGLIGVLLYLFIIIAYILKSLTLKGNLRWFFMSFISVFILMSLANDLNRNFPFSLYFWLVTYYLFNLRNCRE